MYSLQTTLRALVVTCLTAVPTTAYAQFFQAPASRTDSHEYRVAAAGDVNGDGKTDIVALKVGVPSVWEVRVNDGSGNFVTTEVLGTGVATNPTIADADGDGQADVLLLLSTGLRVYWGTGDGRFSTFVDLGGSVGSSVAVGHLNGDGHPDLAISYRSSTTGLRVRYGSGGRQFDAAVAIADVAFATQVSIANIDGDSIPDLFVLISPPVSLGPPSLRVLSGASGFMYQNNGFTFEGASAVAMTATDLNGDFVSEAVVALQGVGVVALAYSGGFPVPQMIFGVSPAALPPAVTDVDGDGRLDIIVAGSAHPTASVLLSQDDGTFTATPAFSVASLTPRWMLAGDVNGDTALDIVAGGTLMASGGSEIAVTLHVPPLRIAAGAAPVTAGSDGTGTAMAEAVVESEHSDVVLSWFNASTQIGTGSRIFVTLPIGVHPLTVRGATPSGLKAVATVIVTITAPLPPASEQTVTAIKTTVDTNLDVPVSSRASQASVTQAHNALLALGAYVQTQLDAPVSSRASAGDVAAVGTKVDQLQTQLPSAASITALTQAVNELKTSLTAGQVRLAIEQALARAELIASFYLPAAHGGQLDLVRTVAVDAVDRSEAAGLNATDVVRARRLIAEGDARKVVGDYRGAYLKYVAAYQALSLRS